MESRSTRMFELKKGKRIGQVLFIVEGEKTEPNLIYRVFSGIFGYQMERIYRDKTYRVFRKTDDPLSRVTVINTEESNIGFIRKDNDFLNEMFRLLIEDYGFDVDNAAIYYLFDRDPDSNTDSAFIEEMLGKLGSARDVNPDMTRQGMLLLSYPCIESFIGMNLLDNSLAYCWNKSVQNGHQLKQALNQDGTLANKITQETLIKSVEALITALNTVGVNTQADELLNSLDRFADNNRKVYDWQEEQRRQKGGYGLLSLMTIALLDLGLIQRVEDE